MNFRCKECQQIFKSSNKKAIFCSRECKNYYNNSYNEDLSLAQKKKILKDRKGECFKCGFNNIKALEVHHIIPVSEGGTDLFSNLQVLCANCHNLEHYL